MLMKHDNLESITLNKTNHIYQNMWTRGICTQYIPKGKNKKQYGDIGIKRMNIASQ